MFEETMFRSDRNRWVRTSREEESNMIPWEEDIIIYNFVSQNITIFLRRRPYLLFQISNSIVCNQQQSSHIPINKTTLLITKMTMLMQTRILKNQEACANTLSMECMDFYHR